MRRAPHPRPASEAETRCAEIVDHLAVTRPDASARHVFTARQRLLLYGLLSLFLLGAAHAPLTVAATVVAALSVLHLASFAFKAVLVWIGAGSFETDDGPRAPAPDVMPLYSLIVPLYREARILGPLCDALDALDYPKDRLQILFAVEADDAETLSALARVALPQSVEIVRVPRVGPRTKPKACAYALSFVRGAFTAIYDAEDQPEPDQLRRALASFHRHGAQTVCVQARLNYFNATETWITRLFAVDYCLWFDFLLPGLERIGAPLPLGGTSNHFRTEALRASGAWDPFNVTEDADLGLRLARDGQRVRTFNSTTFEEAPTTLGPWIRQRTRWIKGYMQTYLVHMRSPRRLWREIGPLGFLSVQLWFLGMILAGLVNPVLWLMFAVWLATGHGALTGIAGPALLALSLVSLVLGNALILFLSLLAPLRRGWFMLVPAALTAPIYWLAISLAAWRALFELFTRPFHWAKTVHGVTGFRPRARRSART